MAPTTGLHSPCQPSRTDRPEPAQQVRARNALAENINGSYKNELIYNRGPWRTVEDVELATLAWVHWWNTKRLHQALGYVTPLEHERAYYRQNQPVEEAVLI